MLEYLQCSQQERLQIRQVNCRKLCRVSQARQDVRLELGAELIPPSWSSFLAPYLQACRLVHCHCHLHCIHNGCHIPILDGAESPESCQMSRMPTTSSAPAVRAQCEQSTKRTRQIQASRRGDGVEEEEERKHSFYDAELEKGGAVLIVRCDAVRLSSWMYLRPAPLTLQQIHPCL